MKRNLIIIIILGCGLSVCGYYYYQHNYVETLMLSEVVGHSDNAGINIAVSIADFDTGLTRHDIKHLIDNKDYWLARMQELNAIADSDLKKQASLKLLSDMMEDPALKKICTGFLKFGTDMSFEIIEQIL